MAKEICSHVLLEAICSKGNALPAKNARVVNESAASQWQRLQLLSEQSYGCE
jgi:hypothetical protein